MKTVITFIAAIGVLLMGCNNSPNSILEDEQIRREIFAGILNNHHYLNELMDSMRTNGHARMMMRSDTAMTNVMLNDMAAEKMLEHLMTKTEKDSMACKMMCGAMMEHKKIMNTMLETLNKSGMVDKACMAKTGTKTTEKSKEIKHH